MDSDIELTVSMPDNYLQWECPECETLNEFVIDGAD